LGHLQWVNRFHFVISFVGSVFCVVMFVDRMGSLLLLTSLLEFAVLRP